MPGDFRNSLRLALASTEMEVANQTQPQQQQVEIELGARRSASRRERMNAGSGGSVDGLDGEGRDAGLRCYGPVLLFNDTARTSIAVGQGFGGNPTIRAL
jgi:hypothetical protein